MSGSGPRRRLQEPLVLSQARRSGHALLCVLALCLVACGLPADEPSPLAVEAAGAPPTAVPAESSADELAVRVHELVDRLSLSEERSAAREAIVALGPAATPALLEHFDDEEFVVRWEMVNIQGRLRDARAFPFLIERALRDENSHVRWRSLWAITAQDDPAPFRESFHAALSADADPVAAWNAAVALSMLDDERCLDAIHAGLLDEDSWRRWEAVNALGRVHDERSAAALEAKADEEADEHRDELLREIETRLDAMQCVPWLWLPESEGGLLMTARDHVAGRIEDAVRSRDPDVNTSLAAHRLLDADEMIAVERWSRACSKLSDAIRALTRN